MQKLEIFPIKLYQGYDDQFPEYRERIIEYFEDFASKGESVQVSNRGGFQSTPFLFEVQSFEEFSPLIWAALKPYFDKICDEITSFGFGAHVTISNLWVNVNYPGSYNIEHTHPHSIYSGVMWIKVPENSGSFMMHHPDKHNLYGTDYTDYEIIPEEGKIIVFPSHVLHSVRSNESDDNRISLSFNITIS